MPDASGIMHGNCFEVGVMETMGMEVCARVDVGVDAKMDARVDTKVDILYIYLFRNIFRILLRYLDPEWFKMY